jgi:hypothetical protein
MIAGISWIERAVGDEAQQSVQSKKLHSDRMLNDKADAVTCPKREKQYDDSRFSDKAQGITASSRARAD